MDLDELCDAVHDRDSFLAFVAALIADREDAVAAEEEGGSHAGDTGATEWANTTIETFLGAGLAWAEESSGGPAPGFPEQASWRAFATFLYCGKIYE